MERCVVEEMEGVKKDKRDRKGYKREWKKIKER